MGYKLNPFTGKLDNNILNSTGGVDLVGDIVLNDGGTYTTTLQTVTPTANRTISLPNATGTVALVAGSSGQLTWNNAGAYAGVTGSSVDGSGNVTLTSVLAGLGTAAAPSHTFTGDSNTGIYSPGADQVALATNGTERARIDASGRLLVGTGTTSLAARAVFQGNSGGSGGFAGLVKLAFDTSTPSANAGLGRIAFTDNGHVEASTISGIRDSSGTWTSGTSQPSALAFSTTADGASSPTERMRISNDGAVKIAGDNFQIATSKTPASATAAGTTGQIAWDASYIYVCTATNTWKRAAIATW